MQRNWIGRSEGALIVRFPLHRRRRGERRLRCAGGVHHPSRYHLRRHLLRGRAPAPAFSATVDAGGEVRARLDRFVAVDAGGGGGRVVRSGEAPEEKEGVDTGLLGAQSV